MSSLLPKYVVEKSVVTYIVALLTVTILWNAYITPVLWWLWGIIELIVFFVLSRYLTKQWSHLSPKTFEKRVFIVTFIITVCYVIVTYFLYDSLRGEPFEYDPSDALAYHEESLWFLDRLKNNKSSEYWKYFNSHSIDDMGYSFYLNCIYVVLDGNILITRIIKSIYRAWMCVLVYRIAMRNFGDNVGRMAAIFCMLLPNFSFYAASHRKEMEMILLVVWFIEQADFLIRSPKFSIKQFILPIVLIFLMFTFRTVLGLAALFSLALGLILTYDKKSKNAKKRLTTAIVLGVVVLTLSGGVIAQKVSEIYTTKVEGTQGKDMEWRSRENSYAKYAGAAVFAPMIVAIPFPTMVDVADQYNQQRLNGGYYIKNIFAFFVVLSIWYIIKNKTYRQHILLYSYTFSYLIIIALSNFAQSERFHLPALPMLMIMAAYGISICTKKQQKYFTYYAIMMCFVAVAWNWIKLSGRGLI